MTVIERGKNISLVVAMTLDHCIGVNGQLPWRLKGDMAFFKKLTTITSGTENKRNAVLMGRKTWESIPEKFRPLPDRLNVILTRRSDFKIIPSEDSLVYSSFETAVKELSDRNDIESIFVIGGSEIYNLSLKSGLVNTLYITEIKTNDIKGDTYFPLDFRKDYEKLNRNNAEQELPWARPLERTEGDNTYEFTIWKLQSAQ